MKRYENDRFDTMHIRGYGRLAVKGETLEQVRAEIDASNERAVKLGYKAEQWLITHRESYRWFEDDGSFVKSEELEQAVEIYPPTL